MGIVKWGGWTVASETRELIGNRRPRLDIAYTLIDIQYCPYNKFYNINNNVIFHNSQYLLNIKWLKSNVQQMIFP